MDPFDPTLTLNRLYAAWQKAEQRYREVPPGSNEAGERLIGVNQLWEGYEAALAKALGRGSLRPSKA
jgi:hypothetical protein